MSRNLDDLTADTRAMVDEWLAACADRGIPVCVVCVKRTDEEQHEAYLTHHSNIDWHQNDPAKVDKHEKGEAVDVAPYIPGTHAINWKAGPGWLLGEDSGQPGSAVDRAHVFEPWATLGELAEKVARRTDTALLGLRWGGRWHSPFDPGHVELVVLAKIEPAQTLTNFEQAGEA